MRFMCLCLSIRRSVYGQEKGCRLSRGSDRSEGDTENPDLYLSAAGAHLCREDGYEFGFDIFNQQPVASAQEGTEVTVEVTAEMNEGEIGEMLIENGLIDEICLYSGRRYSFPDIMENCCRVRIF